MKEKQLTYMKILVVSRKCQRRQYELCSQENRFFSDSIGFIYCDRLFLNGVRCASFGSVIARDEWLATIDAQYLTSSFRLRSASEILGE